MKSFPPPGSVLATYAFGPFTHYGIATERQTVVSGSKRYLRVVEGSLQDFCDGHSWKIVPMQTALAPIEIVRRARERVGEPWRLLSSNCEHFVRTVLGQPKESRQVQLTLFALALYAFLRGKA